MLEHMQRKKRELRFMVHVITAITGFQELFFHAATPSTAVHRLDYVLFSAVILNVM